MTAELQTLEARIEDAMDKLTEQLPALAEKLTPYADRPGGVPLGLIVELVTGVSLMVILAKISLGDDELKEAFAPLLKLAEGAKDPFNEARDAQLSVSPARWQIEQHLNSLSQGGVEQLADALNRGGSLFARVRTESA